MRTPWVSAVWLGWFLACVTLLILWETALSDRTLTMLTVRQTRFRDDAEELSRAFAALEQLPWILLANAQATAANGQLDLKTLKTLREQGRPYCELYWVDGSGRPVASDDSEVVPTWFLALAKRLPASPDGKPKVLRPLPPGLEAGRWSQKELVVDDVAPDNYLGFAGRTSQGGFLLAKVNLEHVWGEWLPTRLSRLGFGGDLTWERGTPWKSSERLDDDTLNTVRTEDVGWFGQVASPQKSWRREVPTFLSDEKYPFDALVLKLDNGSAMQGLRASFAWGLALAGSVMALFAGVLVLATRLVRKQMELTADRRQFTDMVSHELRTPIASISMYLEILRDGLVDDPKKIATYHKTLAQECGRLQWMVDNILTASQLERGTPKVELRPVEVEKLLERLGDATRQLPGKLEVGPVRDKLTLETDPEILLHVLVNLVENAFKHAGADHPVRLTVFNSADEVRFEVVDSGPGISPKDRLRIFEPYRRALPVSGEKTSGMGIGLAVVKGLVDALGGSVICLAAPTGGALFRVSIPRQQRETS